METWVTNVDVSKNIKCLGLDIFAINNSGCGPLYCLINTVNDNDNGDNDGLISDASSIDSP